MAAARKRGTRLGRPPKLSREELMTAKRQLDAKGASMTELAVLHGVHPWTLARSLKRLGAWK